MINENKKSLENFIEEFKQGLNENLREYKYISKGILSAFCSKLPFQERYVEYSKNIPRRKHVYYTNEFSKMSRGEKVLAIGGSIIALGIYYRSGTYDLGYEFKDLMLVHAGIFFPSHYIAISRENKSQKKIKTSHFLLFFLFYF